MQVFFYGTKSDPENLHIICQANAMKIMKIQAKYAIHLSSIQKNSNAGTNYAQIMHKNPHKQKGNMQIIYDLS